MTSEHGERMKPATPNEMIESGPVALAMGADPALAHFGAVLDAIEAL